MYYGPYRVIIQKSGLRSAPSYSERGCRFFSSLLVKDQLYDLFSDF